MLREKATGLTGEKLTFIGPVTPNEVGFVVGYANDEKLRISAVSVSAEFESLGTDTDGTGEARRSDCIWGRC